MHYFHIVINIMVIWREDSEINNFKNNTRNFYWKFYSYFMSLRVINIDLGSVFLIAPQTNILPILKNISWRYTLRKLLVFLSFINMDFVQMALFWVI